MRRTFFWFFLIGFVFVSIPPSVIHFKKMFAQMISSHPYMPPDEGVEMSQIDLVYEGGYTQYRCKNVLTHGCYGGAQTFQDAMLLRVFPESWLKQGMTTDGESVRYPWLIKYPRAHDVIKTFRVVTAAALLFCFFFLAWKLAPVLAVPIVLTLSGSLAFSEAWQGPKHDYPSAVWFFACSVLFCLSLSDSKKRFRYFVASFFVGGIGGFVRVPQLIVTALNLFSFSVVEFFQNAKSSLRHRTWILFKRFAIFSVLGLMLYCFFQPNTFVSSQEASWYRAFSDMARSTDIPNLLFSEIKLGLLLLWPIAFLIWIFVLILKKHGAKTACMRYVPHFFSITVLFVLTARGQTFRSYYYLPVLVMVLVALLFMLRDLKRLPKGFVLLFLIVGIFQSVVLQGNPLRLWKEAFQPHRDQVSSLMKFVNDPQFKNQNWMVDVALHAPISEELFKKGKIQFFNSLTDLPAEFSRKAKEANANVLVTCWQKTNAETPKNFAAEQWAEILNPLCQKTVSINQYGLRSYATAASSPFEKEYLPYVVLKTEEVMRAVQSLEVPAVLRGFKLHPKAFKGSKYGQDHFQIPLYTQEDTSLRAEFAPAQEIKGVQVVVKTSCREGAVLVVQGSTADFNQGIVTEKASLDTSELLCRDYAAFCKYAPRWIKRWSARRYPITVVLPIKIKAHEPVQLSIQTKQPKSCAIAFEEIELVPRTSQNP